MSHDEVGCWSEIKLDIIKDYAAEYSKILARQSKPPLYHIYIDAFAGSGQHKSKTSGEFILGSPLNALKINPPFREYHLIDLKKEKVDSLREATRDRKDVYIYQGDCNSILLKDVFPKAEYTQYRRALCLLDPYDINLNWEVIYTAGQMESIEIFLNFMIYDMNLNVLLKDPTKIKQSQIYRMNAFWGDESWRDIAYKPSKQTDLFNSAKTDKVTNDEIAEAFRQRLMKVAGFKYVPEPIPMRNKHGAIIYYLFFASRNPVAGKIVEHIFNKYRDRGKP